MSLYSEYDLKTLYKPFNDYIVSLDNISILDFDYQTGNNIILFLSSSNTLDIDEVARIKSVIAKTMPSIKRIFAKPIIHLDEHNSIVPIEACRTIDNKTITYLAIHSELWQDIKDEEVLPRKLLTRIYKDNYSIYENILFAHTVNQILSYLRFNLHIMKDLLDSSQSVEINYLDKLDHINYYIALAKLHTSYIRNYDKDVQKVLDLLDNLLSINTELTCRLHRPVYKKNYKKASHITLKSTNILNMQRDYHQVYKLAKFFLKEKIDQRTNYIIDEEFEKIYFNYIAALSIFATTNFNFTYNKDEMIDFKDVNCNFKMKTYSLNIKNVSELSALSFTFYCDKEYKILLIPFNNKIVADEKKMQELSELYNAIYFASPFYSNDDKSIYLSINNLNSFRRLQQLLLKGMIYSSTNFEICPFCGEKLSKIKDEYFCRHCFTKISKRHCDIKDEDYYETSIFKFSKKVNDDDEKIDTESYLHYRNITKIASKDSFICPCCHKVHNH